MYQSNAPTFSSTNEEILAKLAMHDITKVDDLPGEMENRRQEIKELERKGKKVAATKRKDSLTKLEELQELINKIKIDEYKSSASSITIEEIVEKLLAHDIAKADDLSEEIENRKQEIKELEMQGKKATASKRKESLTELEELQELINKMKVKPDEPTASSSSSTTSMIDKEILDRLSAHDIIQVDDLPIEIENKRQQIRELESQGKKATAAKRKESLAELEELQELINKMKVKPDEPTFTSSSSTTSMIDKEILDRLSAHDIIQVDDLSIEIENRIQQIRELESQGKKATAAKRKESLTELEELQELINKMKVKPDEPTFTSSSSTTSMIDKEILDRLSAHDMQVDDLPIEIENRRQQIREFESQEKKVTAAKRKESLTELEELQELINKIKVDEFKADMSIPFNLSQEMLEKLSAHDITNMNDLPVEIENRRHQIRELENQGKKATVAKRKESLAELEELQELVNKMKGLDITESAEDQHKDMEEALDIRLEEDRIESVFKVQSNYFEDEKKHSDTVTVQEYLAPHGVNSPDVNEAIIPEIVVVVEESLQLLSIQETKYALQQSVIGEDTQSSIVSELDKAKSETNVGDNTNSSSIPTLSILLSLPDLQNDIKQNKSLEAKKYRDLYQRYAHVLATMPDCAEKSIAVLGIHFESEQVRKKLEMTESFLTIDNVLIVFNRLKGQLTIEGLNDKLVKQIIEKIEFQLISSNDQQIQELSEEFFKLLKQVQPVDIDLMLHYIDRALSAAKKIEDKDIFLLLGGTGTGKSTTIHFLAGSKMENRTVAGIEEHIAPVDVTNPELASFSTSPFPCSETRSINAITINSLAIGSKYAGNITLCDSPGFGDTEGIELDIANGIGVVRAVKGSRSVKPIILVSQQSIGDRSEGLTKLANILVMFIPRIKQKLSAFTYIFTKYAKKDSAKIHNILLHKEAALTREERANSGFIDLLHDMVEKTKDEVIVLDPINDNPGELLDSLQDRSAICDPRESFHDFATSESLAKLKEQLYKHKLSIERALEQVNIPLLIYKIDQMASINKNLIIYDSQRLYEKCIDGLMALIQNLELQIDNRLSICMNIGNTNVESDIWLCSQRMLDLYNLETVRKNYLPKLPNLEEICYIRVERCQKELQERIKMNFNSQAMMDGILLSNNLIDLNKMHLLLIAFSNVFAKLDHKPAFINALQNAYTDVCQVLLAQYDTHLSFAQNALMENDFVTYVSSMDILDLIRNRYVEHIDSRPLSIKYQEIVVGCNLMFKQLAENTNALLTIKESSVIDIVDIGNVKKSFEIMRAANLTYGIERHADKDYIDVIAKEMEHSVIVFVEEIYNTIVYPICNNNRFSEFSVIYDVIQKLDVLRLNLQIQYATSKPYQDMMKSIKIYITELKIGAQQYLQWLNESPLGTMLPIDYKVVTSGFIGLQKASIFAEHSEKIYEGELDELKNLLINFMRRVNEQSSDLSLNIEAVPVLQVVLELSKHLVNLYEVEKIALRELSQSERHVARLKNTVTVVLDQIESEFFGDNILQNIVKLINGFDFLWHCCVYGADQHSETLSNIITNITQSIQGYFKQLNNMLDDFYDHVFIQLDLDDFLLQKHVVEVVNLFILLSELRSAFRTYNIAEKEELINRLKEENKLSVSGYNLSNQLLLLSQAVFETQPQTILDDWTLGEHSKLRKHQLLLLEDARNIEAGQSVVMVYSKIKLVNELKMLDKLLVDEFSYSNIGSILEVALRTQKISKVSELMLLASTGKYDEFELVYSKTMQATPELEKELIMPIETLSTSMIRQATEMLKKASCFVIDETTLESIQIILEGLATFKRAGQVILNLLPTVGAELASLVEQLEKIILEKLELYQQSTHKFIQDGRFNKVEACLKVFLFIHSICTNSKMIGVGDVFRTIIQEKLDESQKKLQEMLDKQMVLYSALEFTEYAKNPPIVFMNQLSDAAGNNPIYIENRENLKQIIIKKISDILVGISAESTSDDTKNIKLITELTPYLPVDLYAAYISQLKEVQELIEQKDEMLKRMLEESASVDKLRYLVDKLEELSCQRNYKHAYQISTWINGIIKDTANRFKSDLEKGNLVIVVESLPSYWNDWWYYEEKLRELAKQVIPEHAHYFSSEFVSSVINDMVNRITGKVSEAINLIDANRLTDVKSSYKLIEAHFDKFKALLNLLDDYNVFKKKSPDYLHFYDYLQKVLPNLTEGVLKAVIKIATFFANNQQKFIEGLQSVNLSTLREFLDEAKGHITLANNIHIYLTSDVAERIVPGAKQAMLTVTSYVDMCKLLSEQLLLLKDKVKVTLLHNPQLSTTNQSERDNFYCGMSHTYISLTSARLIAGHIDDKIADLKSIETECKTHITNELTKIKEDLLMVIPRLPSEDKAVYVDFNICLDNLRSFKDNFAEAALAQEAASMLKLVERTFEDRVQLLRDLMSMKNIDEIVDQLILFKLMAILIPSYHKKVTQGIDGALLVLSKSENGEQKIATLGLALRQVEGDNQDPAIRLINEHTVFKSYAISIRNQKTLRYTSTEVLKDLKGDRINAKQLELAVANHDELYWGLVENGLMKVEESKKKIIQDAKLIINGADDFVIKIVKLSAHLFAYWTLDNSARYKEMLDVVDNAGVIGSHKNYLLQPHPAQVISIFRLLGVDAEKHDKFENHLVQIGTGEGKSVTLAVAASIFALLGYDVDCACYSEYLSFRDYDAFANLFEAFQLADYIHYGTFNKLSEDFINQRGDVRELVLSYINDSSNVTAISTKNALMRNKILLIDEVDVFFSKDFYGNFYRPLAELRDDAVADLIKYVWSNRHNEAALTFSTLKTSKEFLICCTKFVGWEFLIEEATKEMLSDLKTFESHDYVVLRDKIGYKDQDSISFNINYGFKTLFAYFKEKAAGNITQGSLDARLAITIDSGIYSYAEVPKRYKCIMGVTGTLETLSQPEKVILQSYGIEKSTFMPSVYGRNQLEFAGNTSRDVIIESSTGYFTAIANEINKRLQGNAVVKRAVLVFFQNKDMLDKFYESNVLKDLGIKEKVKLITEHVDNDEKEGLIAQAATTGSVTLLTSDFGRGTDFKCYDDRMNASGGVHVIQTFVSDSCSEETQIKGRTARQGNVGSYSMVLLGSQLERYCISGVDLDKMRSTAILYDTINFRRIEFFEKHFPENMRHVEQICEDHRLSEKFIDALLSGDIEAIKNFLKSRNQLKFKQQINSAASLARTVCLMDATGSMHGLLTKAKNTIHTMFERACDILKAKGMNSTFELQLVVYRNYDCKEDRLLQYSSWESDPNNLRQFMNTVNADGGTWEPEAVEVGLWHVNQVAESMKINQVILIGDAPPNSRELVTRGRQEYLGLKYWETTRFSRSTYVDDEVQGLAKKEIPVHAFYVKSSARSSFEKIAQATGGHCGLLDIDSPAGAEQLTQIVTERILEDLGGVELVELYREKYVKGYISSSRNPCLLFTNVNEVKSESYPVELSQNANKPNIDPTESMFTKHKLSQ